jgi:hypothetical protein
MNLLKSINLVFFISVAYFANAQPPQPIATQNGELEPGYFFMVPFKMSNRHATEFTYLMVLNEKSDLLYYKKVKAATDFKKHPNGLISYFSGNKFYILNKNFFLIDSVTCVNGILTDPHDFLILNNNHYILIGWEIVKENLSNYKLFFNNQCAGSKTANVKYGVVQELDESKKLIYEWKSNSSFNIENADPYFLTDTLNVDITHFNSIDIDKEGNFMVSARYFNEVFKVDKKTGKMLWRFGGKYNSLKLINDSITFYGQHDAKYSDQNRITLFDNGYTSMNLRHNARAIEYEIDSENKTAKLIRSYSNEIYTVSRGTGNMQKLNSGKVLINFGQVENGTPNNSFMVLDEKGKKIISIHFKDTIGTYRAFFYNKETLILPNYEINKTILDGQTILGLNTKHKYYKWCTGETTATVNPKLPGDYYVYVSDDGESFMRSELFKFY